MSDEPANRIDWGALDAHFQRARSLPDVERRALIDWIAAETPELASWLTRMLAADSRAPGALDADAGPWLFAAITDAAIDTAIPQQPFGSFHAVAEIGRGGTAVVYRGRRSGEFEQDVAIKLIKRGMDTDAVIARFRQERRILASLDDPRIARLIDGGSTDDGLPYFVMEFVDGTPIDRWCREQHLSLEARLRLFLELCGAVAHAHQRLVVHRDLKPSNVLVDRAGHVRLLDFGIARVLDDGREADPTSGTRAWMTPGYASPEQQRFAVPTTLSDVYSLGTMLHLLLCGSLPTQPATKIDNASAGRNNAPRPSAVAQRNAVPWHARLRGDIDTIIQQALQDEPQRRYRSADEFGSDIECFLTHRPIAARPESRLYRWRKFVQRNRGAVTASAAVLVSLIAGVVATSLQAQRAREQELAASRAEALATRHFNEVRSIARAVLFDYHDAIKDLPGSTPVRARLLEDSQRYLDALAKDATHDAALQRDLAASYEKLGLVQGGSLVANLGSTTAALSSHRKALVLREQLLRARPGDRVAQLDVAKSLARISALLWEQGAMNESLELSARSVAMLRQLVDPEQRHHEAADMLAALLDRRGSVLHEQGRFELARAEFDAARAMWQRAPEEHKRSEMMRRRKSIDHEHLGLLLADLGDLPGALRENQHALAERAALVRDYPSNADHRRTLAVSVGNNAQILTQLARPRDALDLYRQQVRILEALLRLDPGNDVLHGDHSHALTRVGSLLARLQAPKEAIPLLERALRARERARQRDPSQEWKLAYLIETQAKLAEVFALAGDLEAARRQAAAAAASLAEQQLSPDNRHLRLPAAIAHTELAGTYRQLADSAGRCRHATAARAIFAGIDSLDGQEAEASRRAQALSAQCG